MIIYHAEDWSFSARNEPKVFHSISFNEMEINNLLKTTQVYASYRMLGHDDITADQTKNCAVFL